MSSRAERKVRTMADNWYEKEGLDNDVVLSTKACIVRNVKGYNFMPRLDDNECRSLMMNVDHVIDKDIFQGGPAETIPKPVIMNMIKLQILGREGSQLINPERKSFYFNSDGSLSISVGCGEHINVRAMAPGHDISVYKKAEGTVIELEKQLDIAYSDSYGFLTSNVRLAGTGLRVLYTVALPAIAKTEGGIAALKQRVEQYEWNIYPFAERGELADSNVFIIASINTLGVTEDDVLRRGEMLISDIIKAERSCREEIATNKKEQTADVYGRSYGTLKYCNLITRSEALQALAWLRLYHDYDDSGEIKCSWNMIDKLTMEVLWEPGASSRKTSPSAILNAQKIRADGIRRIVKGDE